MRLNSEYTFYLIAQAIWSKRNIIMKWSLDKQLFTGLALVLFLFNLLVTNDQVWLWLGAESRIAASIIENDLHHPLAWLQSQFSAGDPFQTLNFRLPSAIILVLGISLMIFLSRKILSPNLQLGFLLVLISNFFIIGLGRLGTADSWLLVFQSTAILALIRFLKSPGWTWRLLTYGSIFIAVWLDPLSSLLLFFLLPTVYYLMHKDGKRIWRLNPWLGTIFSLLCLFLLKGKVDWFGSYSYLGWAHTNIFRFVLLLLLGFLPFLGFLGAGLYSGIKNLRQKEEFSLFFIPWVVLALLVQSNSAAVVMAIIIARHVNDYFLERYPFDGIIKGITVMQLIGFFFLASFIMLGGMFIFQGEGFRAGLAFSGVYWMLSFVLVIGLYAKRKRLVFAGLYLSGLLAMVLFSLRAMPLLEQGRIPRLMVEQIEADRRPFQEIQKEIPWLTEEDNTNLYLNRMEQALSQTESKQILIIRESSPEDSTRISGWRDNFKLKNFQLIWTE